ncbi:hypothetical protein TNCV_4217391 [Trichonephila clavipes]|nr:hypothetical protein TNCV_4217391 [Trichonephila clavipes]
MEKDLIILNLGHGSLVVKVMDSWPACYDFDSSTTEDSCCREAMQVKSVEAQKCPIHPSSIVDSGLETVVVKAQRIKKTQLLTSLGKGTRSVLPFHMKMYLHLEVERPGLRKSFLIGGLEAARGCAYGDCFGDKEDVMEIFQSKWTRDSSAIGRKESVN